MALAVGSFTANATWFSNADPTAKTVTVSWAAGDAIVVFGGMESDVRDFVAPTATGLTFTQKSLQNGTSGSEAGAGMWGAIAAASGTNVTVSLGSSGAGHAGLGVWVITGGPTSIDNVTGNLTESALSITVAAGDVVCYGLADFNATNPPGKTPATGSGTATERADTGNGSSYAVYVADWVGTAAGTFSFGPNNYTSLAVAQVACIVRAPAGATNANAGSGPVSVTSQAPRAQVNPNAGGSAMAAAGQAAVGQVRPGAGGAAVAPAAQPATTIVLANAGGAAVGATAQTAAAQVRPAADSAPVAVAGQAPSVSTASTTSAPATVAAVATGGQPPTVQVRAAPGAAAVGVAAADARSTIGASTASAAVAATGQAATVTVPGPAATLLNTFAPSTADPHSLTITGATAGRDVWLIVNTPAVVTTPGSWDLITSRVATMATYIYRLPASAHSGGSIGVTLDLTASRAVAAIAFDAPAATIGTAYASLVTPVNGPGSSAWGTDAHTFAAHDEVLAIFAFHDATGTPPTFTAPSYDSGFTPFADTTWAGTGGASDEAVRIVAGSATDVGFTASGVSVTLTAAGPTGSAVGFLAFDFAPAGTVFAGSAPVTLAASDAAARLNVPATSGPVATSGQAAIGAVAPQVGAGVVTLAGLSATPTVRAQAGGAAVSAAGQAATVNTSSSTNAQAGGAAVGVAGQAPAGQVRPAPSSAPVGAAGLFDAGSLPILQLVMDNPVGIAVSASNATVATSAPTNAPATVAPVTVTGQAPVAQVRAQAGGAAVGVAGQAATASTTSATSANAGSAPVALTAPTPAAAVRATAGVAAVGVAALQPAVSTSNQVFAQAGVAAVTATAGQAAGQVRATGGLAGVTTTSSPALAQLATSAALAALTTTGQAARVTARPAPAAALVAVSANSVPFAGTGAQWSRRRAGSDRPATAQRWRAGAQHPTTTDIT